jgi:hypothetical protein
VFLKKKKKTIKELLFWYKIELVETNPSEWVLPCGGSSARLMGYE